MNAPIVFHFDFSSPYGFIAPEKIEALASGVFGSPYIVVDGEPFGGVDRVDQVDAWLGSGGF